MTHICFVLQSIDASFDTEYALSLYEAAHKALGTLLYSHPNIRMSLAMNGKMLEYLADSHAEFLCILRELLARGQVEVIGGGYYEPLFPLLLPRERTAQIDMLTSAITQATGKRPHTAMLYASSFSDSLVSVLKSNGIDCVLLDSSAVGAAVADGAAAGGIPLVMSDRGKSIDIFPTFPPPPVQGTTGGTVVGAGDTVSGAGGAATGAGDIVRTFCYTPDAIARALADGSFLEAAEAAANSTTAVLSTITQARSAVRRRVRTYIASALSCSVCPGAANIQEYLQVHPAGDDLSHRQTFVSVLIEQYHGDKARKRAARDYLLSSQCGGYILSGDVGAAYKMLNQAESQIRAPNEAVTALDTDEDGQDEYVCRMACHTSVISCGGTVVSFDATAGRGLHRYSCRLFADYLGVHDGGEKSTPSYSVQKFLRGRREVFFQGGVAIGDGTNGGGTDGETTGDAAYGGTTGGGTIAIRKKYIVTSNGFVVQYILKNEGQSAFTSRFFVQFAFLCVDSEIKSAALQSEGSGVSAVRLTDNEGGVSFLIEPNEDAALDVSTADGEAARDVTLSWPVSIESCMECEKTVSLAMLVKDDGTDVRVPECHRSSSVAGVYRGVPRGVNAGSENTTGQLDLWEQE